MNIVEIIKDAVIFPSTNFKKVIFLGIFPAIAALITFLLLRYSLSSGSQYFMSVTLISYIVIFLTNLVVFGYVFRTIQATIAQSDEFPDFDNWISLLIDGFKVYVAQLIYLLIPLVLIFGGGGLILFTNFYGFAILIIIGLLLAFISLFIVAIAIANMAYNDELKAALKFREIIGRISKIGIGPYIVWFCLMIVIAIIFYIIGAIISLIPFIGSIISALVITPYISLIYGRSIALLFKNSIE